MIDGYQPYKAGLLKGNAKGAGKTRSVLKRRKKEKLVKNFPRFVQISDRRQIYDLPEFDGNIDYTEFELLCYAEKILLADEKHWSEEPYWLPADRILDRMKREIYVASGKPDPSIVEGIFYRSHPNGSKLNTASQRKQGDSFYR